MIINNIKKRVLLSKKFHLLLIVVLLLLAVDLNAELWKKSIYDGIEKYSIKYKVGERRLFLNIVKIDLNSDKFKLFHFFDRKQLTKKYTLSKMCKLNDAILGINGSYFELNGGPIGLIINNSKVISMPVYSRAGIAFDIDNKVNIDRFDLDSYLEFSNGEKFRVDQINKHTADGITLYTEEFGKYTGTSKYNYEITVKNDRIIYIDKTGNSRIPEDCYVISFNKDIKSYLPNFLIGDTIRVSNMINNKEMNYKWAISGGPLLLKNGKVALNPFVEGFKKNFVNKKAPRTAIGVTKQNELIFLVVDGRQEDISHGMNLYEVAEVMKRLNVVDAVNLDGGGSTSLYVNDKIVNHPSDGFERKIFNSLLIKLNEQG